MSQPTDNKQLRLYNSAGEYARMSVDEVIAKGLNRWKGWHCSAGSRNLYIDYDGNVWVANCASAAHYSKIHSDRVNQWQGENQNSIDDEWRAYRERVIGEYPHKQWVIDNVGPEHWPMPKENWEDSPAHVALMQEIDRLEAQFFTHDIRDNPLYKQFLSSDNAWSWKSDANSSAWGLLGNVRDGWNTPETWVRCPYSSCGCGADVILSKGKNRDAVEKLFVTQNQFFGQAQGKAIATIQGVGDPTALPPTGVEMNFPIPHQILWDITRRCNYDCSYCWPSVHNNRESYHDTDSILKTIDTAIDTWAEGDSIRWNFGGGEPTMHPDFLRILEHLHNRDQWVLVTTNGSRSIKYFEQLVQYCHSINMSAHFESMDQFRGNGARFIDNCRTIIQHHKHVNKDHWLEIKLMTPPGVLDRAVEFRNSILDLGLEDVGANGRRIGAISLVPIRDINDSSQLVGYSDNEIGYFQQQ